MVIQSIPYHLSRVIFLSIFYVFWLLNVCFVIHFQQQQYVAWLQSKLRIFQMVKWWWVKQTLNELIDHIRNKGELYNINNLFYLFVCSLRESIYQQWRERGWQHTWSPQNLQKHWDREVRLYKFLCSHNTQKTCLCHTYVLHIFQCKLYNTLVICEFYIKFTTVNYFLLLDLSVKETRKTFSKYLV